MDNKFMLIYFLITAQIKSGLSTQKIIQKGTNPISVANFKTSLMNNLIQNGQMQFGVLTLPISGQ